VLPVLPVLTALAVLAVSAGPTRGQETSTPCLAPESVTTVLDQAVSLLREGQPRECLELLRPQRSCLSGDSRFVMLLSRAYEGAGNMSWALKVLSDALAGAPNDCTLRARLAWLLLKEADYRGALSTLSGGTCPGSEEERARWSLLSAEAERQADRLGPARQHLGDAGTRGTMFSEDAGLRTHLESFLWPMRTPQFELRGELSAGWSSNPLLGSPLDPLSSGEDYASFKGELDVQARGKGPWWGNARLVLEGDLRSQILAARTARDLSYAGGDAKPGLELSWPAITLALSYHYDALWLAAPDDYGDKGLLYDGHRGELILQTTSGFYALAGGGHRTFRVMGRSRYETDLGLGWGDRLGTKLFLLAGLSGRHHDAENPAYDLWGATALLALRRQLFKGWNLRASGALATDWYPDSAGSEAFHSPHARRDVLLKGRIGIWSPTFLDGLRAGVQYEPSRRLSTADLFDFADHTVLLLLGFGFAADPWGPTLREAAEWDLVDYGLNKGDGALDERLEDLLRSDEESQRGSSCLE